MDAKTNFASALRTILRQDPDIILVGEIRDLETAEIAMQSGQTGHYVLSTIHTNFHTLTPQIFTILPAPIKPVVASLVCIAKPPMHSAPSLPIDQAIEKVAE